jgi:hypothetical protein
VDHVCGPTQGAGTRALFITERPNGSRSGMGHDGFAHKSAAEPGVPSTPACSHFRRCLAGPEAGISPTSGRRRGREHASGAIWGRGRAYSTFRADRFPHQWLSAYAMNLPRISRLARLRSPEQRVGRRVGGPYEFSLPGNVGERSIGIRGGGIVVDINGR